MGEGAGEESDEKKAPLMREGERARGGGKRARGGGRCPIRERARKKGTRE